ncbi:RNA recognition motif domain eukaryote [Penicillium sp. DV-2018c]|nr:RNA recognition motif domain eukaryote [Penicillium sp. DV-2018c]
MNGDTYTSRDSGRSRDYFRDERRDRDRGDRPERGAERGSERGDRRRSRSPHHGSRGDSRREREVNSYSSSRDYRAREREDRYSGGRRDDREWDRGNRAERGDRAVRGGDRGDRGDRRRRDADDRPRRDLFDDRRGDRGGGDRGGRADRGDRGDRGDRDRERRERERKRSATPPRRKEPTPDLTDVPSVLTRKRRLTQWDIKPPGYENVTAEQAKISGMFPLPGAPRQQPMDPSRMKDFLNPPTGDSDNAALKPSNSRQSKRLFVYNLPPGISSEAVISFFNLQLNGLNVVHSADPCISAQISQDKTFALLEFKEPNDATVALAFDGISMPESGDKGLEVRRPKDYIVPNGSADQQVQEGVVLSEVPDSPNKICVSNIPTYIPEDPVTMLLKSFGELKSFVLFKDASTDESRGIAFCEYIDPAATPIAVEGLNGMELGDRQLKVVRASIGITQASGLEMGVNAMQMFAKTTSQDLETTPVLQLLNMVTLDELLNDEDYEEIVEDVSEECAKFGNMLGIKIPRRGHGAGKIYIKYDSAEAATNALKALAGRKFSDRTVVASYFSVENFDTEAW